jgi:prolyl oligopeptidase
MKHLSAFIVLAMALSSCTQTPAVKYPATAKVSHTDTYFGTEVADPYRWLEDDRSDSTAAWVAAENEVTSGYLDKIPFREDIRKALTQMWNYPKEGMPSKHGSKYFFWKNNGLQNQSVLYVTDGLAGEPRVFIDPNTLSDNGTTRVGSVSVSHDDRYVAYTQSSGGSDWNEIHLKTIDGADLPDVIKWVKFAGIAWRGGGFYYSAYDAPKGSALSEQNQFQKVFYHKLGTPQSADVLVYDDKTNPLRYNTINITDDERYLMLVVSAGTDGNTLAICPLNNAKQATGYKFIHVTPAENFKYEYVPVDNFGDDIYVLTNEDAPKYKLLKINVLQGKPKWETVIPEGDDVLQSVSVVGNKIVAKYLHYAASQLFVFDKDGKNKTGIALPSLGNVGGFSGKKDNGEMFYAFSSFDTPGKVFRIADISNNVEAELYKETKLNVPLSGDYVIKQEIYKSKDGAEIPMFIVHKQGVALDGTSPALLYGYGGFNISMSPGFSITNMFFLEQGGVYAVACLRGGGEFGSEWHKAGTKLQKQNVFDDFIAAAEYLIEKKYTSAERLAIRGGSNGGLLVGACMTQRPDLFKVALPAVGVMDMLRFHKFTVGWGWVDDYGSSDNEEEFRYIYKYSPLHNIKAGACYPATLITTADHDDRVVPAHSFKFAATMQEAQACGNPILIRIETMSGHGSSSTEKAILEYTDLWSFTMYNLGMKFDCHCN